MTALLDASERQALKSKARTATIEALHVFGGEANRRVIQEWALANGGFTQRELTAPPPERALGKYRRAVDHQLSWALTNLKNEDLLEKPRWSIWKFTSAALPGMAAATQTPADPERLAELLAPERLAALRAMPYPHYLKTPEWRSTRQAALRRAGNACSLDATHTDSLEVHHRCYENLGAERVADLVVLCHSCHQLHHAHYGRPRRGGASLAPTPTAAISTLASSPIRPSDDLAARSTAKPEMRRIPSRFRRLLRGF